MTFQAKSHIKYYIARKFGGNNVLVKVNDENFGKKSLANEWISQKIINCTKLNLDGFNVANF